MNTIRVLAVSFLTLLHTYMALSNTNDSTRLYSEKPLSLQKSFPQLNAYIQPPEALTYIPLEEGYISLNDSSQNLIDKAASVLQTIKNTNNYIRNLDKNKRISFPVGIKKTIGNTEYIIGINAIKIHPEYAELEAFMQLNLPENGRTLTFSASDIKFSNNGGIAAGATLRLIDDFIIDLPVKNSQLILHGGDQGTSVQFGCAGFELLKLSGSVNISPELLQPQNQQTLSQQAIVCKFQTEIAEWNDLILQIELPSAEFTAVKGLSFSTVKAVLDLSDLRNAPGLSSFTNKSELFRGLFIQGLHIKLPDLFRNRLGQSASIYADYLIIDQTGVNLQLHTQNLLPLSEGNLGGWNISVDDLNVKLSNNQIELFDFSGKLEFPAGDEKQQLQYSGFISGRSDISIQAGIPERLELGFFNNQSATIYDNSIFKIRKEEDLWMADLILNGKVMLAVPYNGKTLQLGTLDFENLVIRGGDQSVTCENYSFHTSENLNFGSFPLQIESLNFTKSSADIFSIDLTSSIQLGNGNQQFAGRTTINYKSKKEKGKWKTDEFHVSEIYINASSSAYRLEGSVRREENEDLKFFAGTVNASFEPGITVEATAVFGSQNGDRFWYFDAMSSMPSGIPIFGNMAIYGIGGGAYNRVSRSNNSELPGISGIQYTPDPNAGSGFKGSILLGSYPDKTSFQAEAVLEMQFTSEGSLKEISLQGEAHFAVSSEKLNNQLNALSTKLGQDELSSAADNRATMGEKGINGYLKMVYNHQERSFHGNLEVFVNLANGKLTGTGTGNSAGEAVIHFDKSDWYIYLGTPQNPLNVRMQAGNLKAEASAYFVAGNILPDFPPLPDKILSLSGSDQLTPSQTGGSGFIFGARFNVSTGEQEFLMFYGSFEAGAGFDLIFQNQPFQSCSNSEAGWNAAGQAYMFLQGKIGIKVDFLGEEKRIDILRLSTVALVQVSLPSPALFTGMVGGEFEILGGLIKGKCRFEFNIGEPCKSSSGSALQTQSLIADTYPANNSQEISTLASPSFSFNMPVNKSFSLPEGNKIKDYRITLADLNTGNITGKISWHDNGHRLVFTPEKTLPAHSEIAFSINLKYEEKSDAGWTAIVKNGIALEEKQTVRFNTSGQIQYIPANNISYSYPALNKPIIYTGESDFFYIKLLQDQEDLLREDSDWQVSAAVISGTDTLILPLHYSDRLISVPVSEQIPQNTDLRFSLLKAPKQTSFSEVGIQTSTSIETDSLGGTISQQNFQLAEASLRNSAIELLGIPFRTSVYPTITEKLEGMSQEQATPFLILPGVHELNTDYALTEKFESDIFNTKQATHINLSISPDQEWIKDKLSPIYQNSSKIGSIINWRNTDLWGILPLGALKVQSGNEKLQIRNLISSTAYQDFSQIKAWASGQYLNDPGNPYWTEILELPFPSINFPQTFRYEYKVVLPGNRTGKSTGTLNVTFE